MASAEHKGLWDANSAFGFPRFSVLRLFTTVERDVSPLFALPLKSLGDRFNNEGKALRY
ncbi:hypothetical protein [Bombiscardovia coagulans]|uniref:hypothetical protein n=1 Tax=Bombiscardovia coagulans TaxID=686666 RepID=UPI001314055D|nr:hypothetical protein [Bombiscardovia coagulans]